MKRICVNCGAEFETPKGYSGKTLCDACTELSPGKTVMRDRICVDCGVHFVGFPRSLRCESCNAERKRERARLYDARRRAGTTRKIGSIDHCVACGKEYIVNGGLQRYCPDCAPQEIRKNVLDRKREWAKENQYNEKRDAKRQKSAVEIPCVVCGKLFRPTNAAKTCSKECSAALAAQSVGKYEKEHREERTAYHRRKIAEKLAGMTEEEQKAYREKVNEKNRENYWKRLAGMTEEEQKAYREKVNEKKRENYRKRKELERQERQEKQK